MDIAHRWKGGQRRHHGVAAPTKFLDHVIYGLVGFPLSRQGRERRMLRHRRRVRRGVRLERRHRLREGHRRNRPPDAPTRHRVRLCHAVDHDEILASFRDFKRRRRAAFISDAQVNLVGQHPPPLARRQIENGPEFARRVHGARGIAGRIEHDPLRTRRRGGRQLSGGDLEVVVHVAEHRHRYRPRQLDHFVVARPRRCRNEHLVARAEAADARVVQRLLGPTRHHHFCGGDRRAVNEQAVGVGGDGVAKRQNAFGSGIPGCARFDGRRGRLPDERWRIEIGLARAQVDDLLPGRFEGARLGGHRQRRGFLESGDIGGRLEDQRHVRDAERRWTPMESGPTPAVRGQAGLSFTAGQEAIKRDRQRCATRHGGATITGRWAARQTDNRRGGAWASKNGKRRRQGRRAASTWCCRDPPIGG